MEVKFNNQSIELAENTSVLAFVVSQVGDKQNGIAVAVNEAIVPKSRWGGNNPTSKRSFINH